MRMHHVFSSQVQSSISVSLFYFLYEASQFFTLFSIREAMSPLSAALSNFSPVMCSYSSM